ncbi:MAG TPA: rhomboid family intramembrane serine protease, partial [Pyrinomonadaceae bacterium]
GVVGSYLTVRPNLPNNFFGKFFFKPHDVPSAGASGALFGLVGVLFVFGIKFRHELPEGFKRAFGTGMLPIILINLFIGYIGRGVIDNAAHVGGLLAGSALAVVVQYRRPGERRGVAGIWRVMQVAALVLVIVCFFNVARHLNLPPPTQIPAVTLRVDNPFLIYLNAMNQGQEAFALAMHENNASNIDAAIKALDETSPIDLKANELRNQLKEFLTRAKTHVAHPADASSEKDKARLVQDFNKWAREYGEWLKSMQPSANANQ